MIRPQTVRWRQGITHQTEPRKGKPGWKNNIRLFPHPLGKVSSSLHVLGCRMDKLSCRFYCSYKNVKLFCSPPKSVRIVMWEL